MRSIVGVSGRKSSDTTGIGSVTDRREVTCECMQMGRALVHKGLNS
jgi:hypothetical protein